MIRHVKSRWLTGKELIERWGIADFELFDYLKKGHQPYSRYGKQIIDSDSLERAPKKSIEEIEKIYAQNNMYRFSPTLVLLHDPQ